MKIAFDVDGTLISLLNNGPRYEIIQLFLTLQKLGNEMIIWSGCGMEYAERWAEKLGLSALIVIKGSVPVNIAVDDEEGCKLGVVNLIV